MKNSPPRRLIDDPTVSAELRQDLEQSAAATSNYNVAAGFAALQASLGKIAPSQPPPTTPSPSDPLATSSSAAGESAGLSLASKIGLSAVSAALAVSVIFGIQTSSSTEKPHNAVALPSAAPSSAPQTAKLTSDQAASVAAANQAPELPTAAPEDPPAVTAEASPRAPMAATRRHANVRRSSVAEAPTASGDHGNLRLEIDELAQIKSLLPTNPAAAYRLASRGHARFGRGMLYPEREALAVLALSALGRDVEAQTRASRFLTQFPDSPMRARVENTLNGTKQPAELSR